MTKGMHPPPSPLGSGERQYNSGGSRPVTASGLGPGLAVAARTPGTPRKEKSLGHGGGRESSALQDPGLKDYRLGECLGKGAFGSVYKAFNWGTGEAVAVKQIKLADLPKSELRMIESEIELLKNLHHDNIVKYIGFVRSADSLNIILEYCENGSLHSICKAYGKFPENLVGVYMTQVLNGLNYLHDQGVIHRDIKGANILTTKDGTVKLADFGVSTSTLTGGGQDKDAQVVGTPYWMAPEIIQLSGAIAASDIWSVGCTVIELLQGKPPYHNLAAMPALFAIVNDDHPPLPEGISMAARDFLMQCFQKNPDLRVSARKLLRHAWIISCKRSDAPVPTDPTNFSQAVEEVKQWNKALNSSQAPLRTSMGAEQNAGRNNGSLHNMAGFVPSQYGRRGPLALAAKRPPITNVFRSPELADNDNWDDDFASAISPSALHLPHIRGQDNFGGLLSADRLKSFASGSDHHRTGSSSSGQDDSNSSLYTVTHVRHDSQGSHGVHGSDDGDEDGMNPHERTIRPISRRDDKSLQAQSQAVLHSYPPRGPENSKMQIVTKINNARSMASPASAATLTPMSPSKPHFGGKFELPSRPDVLYREETIDDFSDLFVDNDNVFKRGLHIRHPLSAKEPPTSEREIYNQPSGSMSATELGFAPLHRSSTAPVHTQGQMLSPVSPAPASAGGMRRPGQQAGAAPHTRSSATASGRPMRRARSSIEIEKFAENEGDADFSDIFLPDDSATERDESDHGSEAGDGALMLMSKMSGSSWLGDDDDEHDPFASLDQGFDQMDLEANIARDRHARLSEKIESLVRSMSLSASEDDLSEYAAELLDLLYENTIEVKRLFISAHGLLPILEILEPCTPKTRYNMVLNLLQIVNIIILDDVGSQENLCFVGGIPIITKFAARQYSNDIRRQAAAFVEKMYETSTLTLQMFVSAGGLNVLSEFLDEDYDAAQDFVRIGVNGISNVFDLQGPTPKNDFCRIFARSKILYPLALVLHRVLDDDSDVEKRIEIEGRIVNIFYLFSQAENYVKEVVADRQVLKSVLKDLRRMTPQHQVTMLKFIKNLSMLSTTLESLHSADAIEFLIDVLSFSMRKAALHFREISNQVLNTMFNLCRLSKERQEDAAVGGIIPLLLKIMGTDHPPKEFALPILCDMAHSGSKGRRYLWQNKGLDFYVSLLADQYWQVTALDAINVWLQEETANVENHLLACNFTAAIMFCFDTNRLNSFDSNLLEPLLKLLRLSPYLAASLAKPEMFAGIAQRLGHKKPVVRLNLLRLVRTILDACEPGAIGAGNGSSELDSAQVRTLMETIQKLAEDPAVLVRNLAQDVVKLHIDGAPAGIHDSVLPSSAASVVSTSSSRKSGSSNRRRHPSYTTSPSLHHPSTSTPPTPTHNPALPRSSNSALSSLSSGIVSANSAYIEVAASPRRPTTAHERESLLYRPRSRETGTGLPRRISGDSAPSSATSVLATPGKLGSRLPRNPGVFLRSGGVTPQGQGPQAIARSDSALSNKENSAGVPRGYRSGSGSRSGSGGSGSGSGSAGTGSAGSTVASSSSSKRRRPQSSDLKGQVPAA